MTGKRTVVRFPAAAKINLCLGITATRADGMHDLDSLAVFAGLHDMVEIRFDDEDSFTITGAAKNNLAETALADNIIGKAFFAFFENAKTQRGGHHAITLTKNIPIGAGLGGGSADAAATLIALNDLHGTPLDGDALLAIAETLGADVPLCLMHILGRGPACIGVHESGDTITPIPIKTKTPLGILLVHDSAPLATAAVFAAYDKMNPPATTPADSLPGSLKAETLAQYIGRGNVLTAPAISLAPEIEAVLDGLRGLRDAAGFLGCGMTGSGATCFALFMTADNARKAQAALTPSPKWSWAGEII